MLCSALCSKPGKTFYISVCALAAAVAVWAAINLLIGQTFAICPIKLLFGVPCPGCGLTRAAFAMCRGDFSAAWRYNPLAYALLPIICFFVALSAYDIIAGRDTAYRIYCRLNALLTRWLMNPAGITLLIAIVAATEWHHLVNHV